MITFLFVLYQTIENPFQNLVFLERVYDRKWLGLIGLHETVEGGGSSVAFLGPGERYTSVPGYETCAKAPKRLPFLAPEALAPKPETSPFSLLRDTKNTGQETATVKTKTFA